MPNISALQLGQFAYQAGFRGNALTTAIAVSFAENTSHNTTAKHINNDGSTDYGLWQINSIHTEYSPALLLTPLYNAQAAYKISSYGSDWTPWSTFNDGKYKQYISSARAVTNGASTTTNTPVTDVKPWWFFPRIDNYGAPDSFGGFPKPDSNIQVPANYPIAALLSGTVSGINSPTGVIPDWGAAITIKLDVPINRKATHTAYIHLASIASGLRVGSHVQAGQLIGYNGGVNAAGAQKVPLGFALYEGDVYGYDHWNPGDPLLNMTPLLNAAAAGNIDQNLLNGTSFATVSTSIATYTPVTQQVHQTLVNTPGFYGMSLALDEAEQFPGYINLANSNTDISGIARSIGATIGDNFLPTAIRSGLVLLGLFVLVSLVAKPAIRIAEMGAFL